MTTTFSPGPRPGRSLAVGLFAALLWKAFYQAAEAGYLTWLSAAILVIGVATLAVARLLVRKVRVSVEQALVSVPTYASKA